VNFGNLELHTLSDGTLRLDGGAMFGVVPKPLWEKRAPADNRNRILLGMRPLLVRGERTMLIDAGVGSKMDEKSVEIYGIDRTRDLDRTALRSRWRFHRAHRVGHGRADVSACDLRRTHR
jgi:hypothetical protein